MDLRREIQNIKNENKSNIDKKDKETFSKWLDGEKISEVDYENCIIVNDVRQNSHKN